MKTKTFVSLVLFCLIFGLAFYLRQFTLWLPHWQGDQSQYIMTAMKFGTSRGIDFSEYNLQGINTETLKISSPPGTEIIFPYRAPGHARGFVMDVYYAQGLQYYDTPLFFKAPFLPMVLSLSHRLLADDQQPYSVVRSNLGKAVLRVRPQILLQSQLWAAIVPLTASLLILCLIYFWTRRVFGEEAALIAAFIFATNPVSILTSNRIWTEDLTVLFLTAAMLLYRHGFKHARVWICGAAGILMGLAVLTNQKAILGPAALGIYSILMMRTERLKWSRMILDARGWVFLACLAAVTTHWSLTSYRYLGNAFWQPELVYRMLYGREITSLGAAANSEAWYRVLLAQPHGMIYYSVGTIAICWAFAAGYLTLRDGLKAGREAWKGRAFDDRPLFFWCWIAVFAAYFLSHRTGEYRYLFPIYPALAVLSGWMLTRVGDYLTRFTARRFIAKAAVYLFLIVSAVYSVRIIQPVLWEQKNLILTPWS